MFASKIFQVNLIACWIVFCFLCHDKFKSHKFDIDKFRNIDCLCFNANNSIIYHYTNNSC